LPEASAAVPLVSQPKEIVINVDREGGYTVRSKPHTKADLFSLMKQAEANNPGRASILIRADKRCYWESVSAVIDLCKQAKIRQYRVSAVP
jgi:biopolymer transport protein ExbD